MSDLRKTTEAWAKAISHTAEEHAKAEAHREMCISCPEIRHNPVDYCNICKCPIAAKIYSDCPIGKFSRV